jgi:threonine dehydrogenase-like Zn-dependent dehydrogenase
MRAVTYDGPYRVKVRDRPEPRIEHPQDGIVRVTAAAICGSDLHLLHGLVPDTRIGSVFGHEFVGIVEETGPQVEGVQKGDRVMLPFQIFCGGCYFCARGLTSYCDSTNPATDATGGIYGYSHTTGGYDGGQAEYVRVPFIGVDAEKLPDDVEDLDALPITDAFTTGYQAAEMCGLRGGEAVLVLGCGPVGLFSMWSAWAMGAGRVIAVDHVDYRLDFARDWLGVETLDLREVDLVTAVKEMTEGRGADATIDAVGCEAAGSARHRALGIYAKLEAGSPHALNLAIHATRKGGTISVVGVYGPPFTGVDIGTYMNKAQTMRTGQTSVKRYMPHLLEHVREGRIQPRRVFTHCLPLEQAPRGYRAFARKRDRCIKVALLPATGPAGAGAVRRQSQSGEGGLQPGASPSYRGIDLDLARRPGVPMMRPDPRPLPHARFPPERQRGEPASPTHGRPGKPVPPVFGTAVPLRGLSGAVRRLAYRYPDHLTRHWYLKMLGDRVESWERSARRYLAFALPAAMGAALVKRGLRAAGRGRRVRRL